MDHQPLVLPSALSPLVEQSRWVVWKWVTGKNGKRTKPPYQGGAPEKFASSTDPATWCAFETAAQTYNSGRADGIGFALPGSGVGAFDIDHCRDATSGTLHPWASALVQRCASYTEITPSGTGVRILGTAGGPALHKKLVVPNANGVQVEVYRDAERYITVSGVQIGDADKLVSLDAHIDAVMGTLAGKPKSGHDLESLIRDGCGDDFGGDRSRAVWYVINQLLKQGRPVDDIVELLLDRANGISAHVYDQANPEAYARRQVEKAQKENTEELKDDSEIKRLAQLSAVQYERERKRAAERLGIRAGILDRLVQAERPDDDDGKQGRVISFPDPEPWPEPVDGAALLDSIAEAIGRYVVLPEHSRDTAALWILHSYLPDCFLVSPRLAICSPVKRCGKTTLLDVLACLVLRPLPTANVTSSAMFRVIEAYRPTLLVDEADTFLRENDELRGIINSGHRRGGSVLRAVGDDHEPRAFATYSACAIALIGKLPDTLHDRSVVIDLKRRLPNEPITPFRPDRAGYLDTLARQAAHWGRNHAEEIGAVDPDMPTGIYNREADNWRPLLAIAHVAGGHWSERARKAVAASHDAAGDDESRITVLLGDIRDIFAERAKQKGIAADASGKLPSSKLANELAAVEGRPWAEYGKARKPISQNQVARLLRPVGIAPDVLKIEGKNVRTYQLHLFADAFMRYLPPEGADNRSGVAEADKPGTSGTSQNVAADSPLRIGMHEKSNNDGLGYTATVVKGEEGQICEGGDSPEATPLVCEHCGNPETATQPVREYTVEGVRCLLHPNCEQEWLDSPGPNDWTFNLEQP